MHYILVLIVSLCLASLAGASQPLTTTWSGVRGAVISLAQQVGVEYLAQYLQNSLQPQDLKKIQAFIAALKVQVQEAQSQSIPDAEVQKIRNVLASTEQLAKALTKRVQIQITNLANNGERLAQDVALLQNELVQLRDQLRTLGVTLAPPITAGTGGINLPVQVNYTYRSQDDPQQLPLTDGTELSTRDRYKITFTPERVTWVYIFQVDATGKIRQLFPLEKIGNVVVNQTNPVAAGETRSVPSPSLSFHLPDNLGTKTIYFIASLQQDMALETRYNDYQQILQTVKPADIFTAQAGLEIAILFARGPAGVAPDPTKTWQRIEIMDETAKDPMVATYLNGVCGQVGGCINMLRFKQVK